MLNNRYTVITKGYETTLAKNDKKPTETSLKKKDRQGIGQKDKKVS